MYIFKWYTGRCIPFLTILLVLILASSGGNLWGEEKIETIERPLLGDDIPAIRVKSKEHDHSKHKKREPVILPGPEGKFQIGERKGNPAEGEEIFKELCIFCHGKKGLGDGVTVIGLKAKPKSFIRKKGILTMKDQEIFDIITYGVKTSYQLNMPAWGPRLTVEERLDVLAYIKKLAKKTKREVEEKGADEEHKTP
ncbi:MAG: c-type cytochrome [Thermodesulfobacteriota bacterium]